MLSKVAGGIPEIIDMGHTAPRCNGKTPFEVADLEVEYCANETFMGLYDEQSDIFSATAVLYTMLFGAAPWEMTFTEGMTRARRFTLIKEKRKSEELSLEGVDLDDKTTRILQKGLAVKYEDRFNSVEEIISLIDGKPCQETTGANAPGQSSGPATQQAEDNPNAVTFSVEQQKGNGFADIAGMKELKDMLYQRVIFVIKNKELAERYKLTPPNGMLLYGPPGCGKTFFAEKFAEETGFNFLMVKTSDLASIYIHGSQQMIGKLFDEARAKAPTVLCFDEFDALVPSRKESTHASMAGEVNEFLSQLNNCGKKGVFVIATSNRPDMIDPAVLRTGRIDRMIYVPVPDKDARRVLFEINLKGRPTEDVDCAALAERTVNFVASDIAYAVNDAAITAAFANVPISQKILCETLDCMRPSVTEEMLAEYDKLRDKMTGMERRAARTPIGFKRQTH